MDILKLEDKTYGDVEIMNLLGEWKPYGGLINPNCCKELITESIDYVYFIEQIENDDFETGYSHVIYRRLK